MNSILRAAACTALVALMAFGIASMVPPRPPTANLYLVTVAYSTTTGGFVFAEYYYRMSKVTKAELERIRAQARIDNPTLNGGVTVVSVIKLDE